MGRKERWEGEDYLGFPGGGWRDRKRMRGDGGGDQ